jgi:arylsulfatase A-like enzyme
VDDLGWKDVGCYGSSFYETPNIDRLAAQGMKFTQAYAASPVCSPTRASIMSGKNPARLHITDWIGGKQKGRLLPADYEHQLPLEEVTIAEALKAEGYAAGFFGKWHLGDAPYFPEKQGFDVNKGGHSKGHPASYFYPYKNEKHPDFNVPGLEDGQQGEYLTDRLTDEALKYMENHKDAPFFLFLSHYAVHTPIQAKEKDIAYFKNKKEKMPDSGQDAFRDEHQAHTKLIQDDPVYAAMVKSVDESIGRVVNKIETLGLSDNTIIIFMSDNGGLSTLTWKWSPTSNEPLRAGKGWLYEGGIREPLIIKWPGKVKAGSVCNEPVVSMDFYPTILQMCGLPLKPQQHKDGLSLVPLLTENKQHLPRTELLWHFPHYHGSGHRPSSAIRVGDYKLIKFYEGPVLELYDLKNDPYEKENIAEKYAQKTEELHRELIRQLELQKANLPKGENPAYKEKD